jgi:N5-(cytidine 5'-diphosphoramidyl)-L-glutamine hydrolase
MQGYSLKKIAITPRLSFDEHTGELRVSLDTAWIELLEEAGFEVLIVPYGQNMLSTIRDFGVSGVILSGGGDLSVVNPSRENALRDEYEKEIVKFAIDSNIPLLGVCRGMQFLGVYFGGHLCEVVNHRKSTHLINLNDDFLGQTVMTCNSYHNYALKDAGEVSVVASSQDGVIEAVKHKEHSIFGIMWHPEREKPFDLTHIDFLRRFFI